MKVRPFIELARVCPATQNETLKVHGTYFVGDHYSGAFYEATALLINVVRNVRAELSSNPGVTATVSAAVISR